MKHRTYRALIFDAVLPEVTGGELFANDASDALSDGLSDAENAGSGVVQRHSHVDTIALRLQSERPITTHRDPVVSAKFIHYIINIIYHFSVHNNFLKSTIF